MKNSQNFLLPNEKEKKKYISSYKIRKSVFAWGLKLKNIWMPLLYNYTNKQHIFVSHSCKKQNQWHYDTKNTNSFLPPFFSCLQYCKCVNGIGMYIKNCSILPPFYRELQEAESLKANDSLLPIHCKHIPRKQTIHPQLSVPINWQLWHRES